MPTDGDYEDAVAQDTDDEDAGENDGHDVSLGAVAVRRVTLLNAAEGQVEAVGLGGAALAAARHHCHELVRQAGRCECHFFFIFSPCVPPFLSRCFFFYPLRWKRRRVLVSVLMRTRRRQSEFSSGAIAAGLYGRLLLPARAPRRRV